MLWRQMLRPKTILTYVALVGFPLLALTGVLSFGRSLRAPGAVAGPWKIESETARSACACTGMFVSQSGADVTFVFDGARHTTLFGQIRDNRVIASGAGSRLNAVLAGPVSERRLSGSLGGEPFTAVRVKPSRKDI